LQKMARKLRLLEYIEEAPRNLKDLCWVLCSNNFTSEFFPLLPPIRLLNIAKSSCEEYYDQYQQIKRRSSLSHPRKSCIWNLFANNILATVFLIDPIPYWSGT
jgi:hypothetical protein